MNKNPDPQYKSPYGNPEEDGSDINTSEDDSDFDNYWNKEGVFEYASDKRDEHIFALEEQSEEEPPKPEWDKLVSDEYEQDYDESYQKWATEEALRNDEIEEAMREYFKTQDS